MKKNHLKNLVVLVLLAGYVWIFLRLYFTGKITYYIHPDFAPLVLITAFSLLLILTSLIVSFGWSNSGGKLSAGLFESKIRLLLVFIPIVLFVFFQPRPLSSQAFLTRSVGGVIDLGLSRNNDAPVEFVLNSENRELVDWIRLFSQNAEPDTYKGMKARVTGFVLKDENSGEGYFTIARFVISCCAADARPVGLRVKFDPAKFSAVSDQWLEIKGKFDVEEIGGERKPILILEEAKPIEVPANPYIS